MLRIVTDTASDITIKQAENMDVDLVPLKIVFEDGEYCQEVDENFQLFYKRLSASKTLPKTSQPSPEMYLKIFKKAKEAEDDVLVLALSGGLSGTVESAYAAKNMAGYERIYIVDTHQAIIAQRMLVEYAVRLREEQLDTEEIVERIEYIKEKIVVCGVVDTLVYLRKGGRIPKGLAMIGEAMHIKPVIVLENAVLKTMGKVRGRKQGIEKLYTRMIGDGINQNYPVYFGYTSNREIAEEFMEETRKRYQLKTPCRLYPVGGIIGMHCGTDCIAVAYVKHSEF